jgi:hypothetical protein
MPAPVTVQAEAAAADQVPAPYQQQATAVTTEAVGAVVVEVEEQEA